jgi:uncharacterized protein (UPF0332 family)
MEHLKNKSEMNLSAAEFLHKNNFYSSVIHCAYYSCVQLMKHIWLNSMEKSEDDLRKLNVIANKGSHEVLINQMKGFIKNKSQNERQYYKDIIALKRLRVNADYNNISIDINKSEQSIRLSKSTQNILKKCI